MLFAILFVVFVRNVNGQQCLFTAQNTNKILNLTNYIIALNNTNGVQCSMQGCSGCGYQYSACKNGVLCDTEKTKSMVIQNNVSNGRCAHELAMYDKAVQPTYFEANNSWLFQYKNGETCEEESSMDYQFNVLFSCSDDSWPQAQTGSIGTCQYQMNIASMYSC